MLSRLGPQQFWRKGKATDPRPPTLELIARRLAPNRHGSQGSVLNVANAPYLHRLRSNPSAAYPGSLLQQRVVGIRYPGAGTDHQNCDAGLTPAFRAMTGTVSAPQARQLRRASPGSLPRLAAPDSPPWIKHYKR